MEELDDAQEQLLKWMLYTDEESQEEDLDEMVDYDALGAEEYEDLLEGEPNRVQCVTGSGYRVSHSDHVFRQEISGVDRLLYIHCAHLCLEQQGVRENAHACSHTGHLEATLHPF